MPSKGALRVLHARRAKQRSRGQQPQPCPFCGGPVVPWRHGVWPRHTTEGRVCRGSGDPVAGAA